MTWSFGDSFDLYAAVADAFAGYWDSGNSTGVIIAAGRFAGSQAWQLQSTQSNMLTKSSAVNDAVHHIVVAFRQTAALSGTTLGGFFELFDGTTAQCSIVFRSDGAILLTSGGPAGTVLATYTGAVAAQNTWYGFEFEVVINNTTGSFAVRKNGDTSNDFSATSLNTRGGTANNYANKLTVGMQASVSAQQIDDLFWQSGAATGAWLGDIRCYARMPASDQSVVFSRSPVSVAVAPAIQGSTPAIAAGTARYAAFAAPYDGVIASATVSLSAGYSGNMKCSIFASSGSAPTIVLGSATPITNPATGVNTFTFGAPVAVTKGAAYFIGFDSDASSGAWNASSTNIGVSSTTGYAAFPVASPTTAAATAPLASPTITVTNSTLVNEAQQDGAASYVYDSTPGDADFYNIGSIGSTPASVIAVTTRAFMEKSDVGARAAAVQLKSGGTTVASPTLSLSTSFLWAWRTDVVDPNTSAAWTAAAVNNAQIGPKVVA